MYGTYGTYGTYGIFGFHIEPTAYSLQPTAYSLQPNYPIATGKSIDLIVLLEFYTRHIVLLLNTKTISIDRLAVPVYS